MSEETTPAREPNEMSRAERDDHAARLRTAGYEYAYIAAQMGYANASGAYKAVQRALVAGAEKRAEPHDLLRMMENARLDRLITRAVEVMETRHYATNNSGVIHQPSEFLRNDDGSIVMDDKGNLKTLEADPLIDDAPTLDAIRTIIKLMERKARMNGLDAPTRREVITLDAIEAEIARLEESANNP